MNTNDRQTIKRIFISFIFCFQLTGCYNSIIAREKDINAVFKRFDKFYNSGDFANAEKMLRQVLYSDRSISKENLGFIYNALGVTYTTMGNYLKAQEYYGKAESELSFKGNDNLSLAAIYINKGIIFDNLKAYSLSKEYYEKGIRLYLDVENPDRDLLFNLSTAFLNFGIVYYETGEYESALYYLRKSASLKKKYSLSESAFVFLNIAKTLSSLKCYDEADRFFRRSIESCNREFGENYYRLAEIYFGYGLFLQSQGRYNEALKIHQNALLLNLKNYGEKHTFVALSYKHIGDDYLQQNKIDSALNNYQRSLISVVKGYSNDDIFENPLIDSSLFDLRLLDNLKSKSVALELYSDQQTDPELRNKILNCSIATIELALSLIDRIRNNYMSEESRIYLAENEKETWIFATRLYCHLFNATHDNSVKYKMYSIAQRAKAAILRNDITGNELLWSSIVPDSLREKQNRLSGSIAAFNRLILEETQKTTPDIKKIAIWKDDLFEMNRDKEKTTAAIENAFPQYNALIRKTDPLSITEIQKKLRKDETIVDYLLSNRYYNGKRKLYVFLISRNNLDFKELSLDSLFMKNSLLILNTGKTSAKTLEQKSCFEEYSGSLNFMYVNLFKPLEGMITSNKLIIIPDEEIGWLPFDAFVKNKTGQDQADYEGLDYLIRDYTFSYGYSSSLIFREKSSALKGVKVYAFSPDYKNTGDTSRRFSSLRGAGEEISSVLKWFNGKKFTGIDATKANFLKSLNDSVILHLAMHSSSDSLNSKYSFLMFDSFNSNEKDARLYNYEISLKRIKSPMVVLSACNSGTGTLYYGEGLMSLARSFTIAGASSVIKTSWEINDEKSMEIIKTFYHYLEKGKGKNEAMRLAKLDYLKYSSPVYKNPYFWAAYEVIGDNTPISQDTTSLIGGISEGVLLTVVTVLLYFRRRRIFSAPSL